ncbi:MAG: PAS domain S-box protein, partial [Rhodospirillales bacterium]|nr:PAS domain S-box protein [Rhodospirillales bacterium]
MALTPEERGFLRAHPVLRLGVGVAFPPFQYVEKKLGKPAFKGMVSDYVKLLSQRLGVRMEPVFDIPFKQALAMGRAREIDVFPAVADTPERREFLIYTKPYLSYPLVIITRDDSPFVGSVEDLHGKKVAIVKTLATYSKFLNDQPGLAVDFQLEKDIPSVLTAVSLGKADACVVNLAVASYLINTLGFSNLHVAAPTFWGNNKLAMGVRNDWPLLAGILQKGLDSLSVEETSAIVQRWISLRYENPQIPWLVNRVVIPGGIATIVIFALVMWWNRRLRREVTVRERAEQALRESEERFSKAFHANPAAMVISNIDDGKIFDVNDRWISLMGFAREEAIGKTAVEVGGWVDIERRAKFVEKLKAEGTVFDFEADLRAKNKKVKAAVLSAETIEIGGEKVLLVVVSDITERKEMERALRESESRLRAVFDNTPVCLNLKDLEGRYLLVNKPYEEWFGRSAEEVIGKKASEFLPDNMEVETFTDTERRVLESGEVLELDVTIPRAEREVLEKGEPLKKEGKSLRYDGTLHDRYLIKFPVKSEDGSINAIGTVAVDVTERKSMERQLHHAQKMEAVGQLTGGIAHDFNNHLQVIQGNLELVMDGSEGDGNRIRQCVNRALVASQRGGKLTQQLLAFSRKQTLYPEPTDANQLVEGMLDILVRTLGEEIEIKTDLKEEIDPITIDRNGLENAILNLAVNAKNAMPNGGRLTIGCAPKVLADERVTEDGVLPVGRYVEMSVTDTGQGMPPEVLARALEPFFTTREVGEGSGLGLSMVYGFARQSDGHMTLESEVDAGTTVRILIPAARQVDTPAAAEKTGKESTPGAGSGTVLVVEDDPDVRQSAVMVLKAHGYNTREAEDAFAALEMLREDDNVDVLFSDVVMPKGMNGLELAREVTELHPGLR